MSEPRTTPSAPFAAAGAGGGPGSGPLAPGGAAAASRGAAATVRRYLSCIRWRDIFLLQGAPLLGAAFAMGAVSAARLGALAVFAAASLLLVAHIFELNDWAGVDADLNDAHKAASVFAAKGLSRAAIRNLWIAFLLLSLALFARLGPRPLALALAIAGLGFVYSLPAAAGKSAPVLGSLLHLAGGALHFLLGYCLFRAIDGRGAALALFFGLVFAAGHLNQEVRDFDGDRQNGIRTNAVVFGRAAAYRGGLVVFGLAYLDLAALAAAGLLPRWLAAVALLLFPLHLHWWRRTLAAGLSFDHVGAFQRRYRALFAILGVALLAALLLPPGPLRRGAPPGAAPQPPAVGPSSPPPAHPFTPAARPATPPALPAPPAPHST